MTVSQYACFLQLTKDWTIFEKRYLDWYLSENHSLGDKGFFDYFGYASYSWHIQKQLEQARNKIISLKIISLVVEHQTPKIGFTIATTVFERFGTDGVVYSKSFLESYHGEERHLYSYPLDSIKHLTKHQHTLFNLLMIESGKYWELDELVELFYGEPKKVVPYDFKRDVLEKSGNALLDELGLKCEFEPLKLSDDKRVVTGYVISYYKESDNADHDLQK